MQKESLKQSTLTQLHELIESLRKQNINRLPPENELISLFQVGRNTLRSAAVELEKEGILERVQGKGTFIKSRKTDLTFANWVSVEIPSKFSVENIIQSFREQHPDINLKNVPISYNQYVDELLSMYVHGNAPDTFLLNPYWFQRLYQHGFLRKLDGLIGHSNITRRYTADAESCRMKKELYAINWGLAPLVLYYNKAVLERAGIDPDSPPETLEDLAEACRQVNEKGFENVKGIVLPLDPYEPHFMWLYPFLMAFGGGFADQIGSLIIDSENSRKAFHWLHTLNSSGGVDQAKTISDARILFATDHAAFIVDGPYGRGFYRNISGEGKAFDSRCGVTTVPIGPSGNSESILLAHSLGISSQCRDPENAAKWIEFLTTDEESARRYYEETGMIPGIRDILHKPFFTEDPFAMTMIRQINTASVGPIKHPLFPHALPFLMPVASDIVLGKRSVEEGLTFLKEIITLIGRSSQQLLH